jgi:DNA-binding MarR family transcriptional regulator
MPTNTPHRTFGFVLHDVARLMRKRFEQKARSLGLTRSQWQVLAHLARHEGIGQSALADILEIEPITLGRLLDRLENAGLVERRANPRDRRAWQLFLADKAHPILDQVWELAGETRDEAMAGLTPSEQDRLLTMLLTIRSNLSERTATRGVATPTVLRSADNG